MLPAANPSLQRAIAEALGRLGEKQAVPALLAAGAKVQDRVLEHSLTYALIELDARGGNRARAGSKQPYDPAYGARRA